MINLKEHIIFVESLNMEVVPYSVAKAALEEVSNPKTDKYFNKLDNAVNELENVLKDIKIDD